MKFIDIVFKDVEQPNDKSPKLEFVEVENAQGESVGVGRWIVRADGFTVLRLFEDVTKSMTVRRIEDNNEWPFGKTEVNL